MTDPASDALRVGDRERELAVAVLHEAVGGGYLDLQEFEERSVTVYAARTRGDLRSALADLPDAARLFPPAAAAPGGAGVDVDAIAVDWTTVRRQGPWRVPGHLYITGTMGTADLDLRAANLPPGGCVIEVRATWSTVKIRLGDAVIARTDDFGGGSMTTVKDKAGPPTVPGGPVVDIRGETSWTTVTLRRK
ncbi:DUF1707 SHOCT-like domain-containing protein [Nakamurella deserti]|uniref:DUF1707 SHOCT-like domain-containing protein n=1 Tax=Nakamurella deserti TaxID=2164074 RepID=UPI000DBE5D27|nr:DUF1707 domain-containing protein [Nakamurella deserti]